VSQVVNPKREAILQAVLTCLLGGDGEEKLTIANVAKRLDIGKSTVYEYFENKEELVKGALELAFERNAPVFADEAEWKELSFRDAFFRFVGALIDSTLDNQKLETLTHHPEVAVLSRETKRALKRKMRRMVEDIRRRLAEILAKGVEEAELAGDISPTRQETIEMLVFGVVMSFGDPVRKRDRQAALDDLYESVKLLHR